MSADTADTWANSCSECRYWNPLDAAMRVRGECRRQLAPMARGNSEIGASPALRDWPVTVYNEWCGEGRLGEKPSAAASCGECRLFRPLHQQRGGRAPGVCQRWLPQRARRQVTELPVPGLTPEEKTGRTYRAAEWPTVTANLWCGDGVRLE